jgi:fucose 4-O-acetylase-like acetyltransferase
MSTAPPPEERDRFIDLLRVACIIVVVVGHWATTTVVWEPDRVLSINALSVIAGARPATWLIQVMPLVFFAGGFANSVARRRSSGYLNYLDARLGRLLFPTGVFLAVWLALGLATEFIDPASPGKARAAEVAALPLWFLGIYLVAVALAPAMEVLHRRFGLWAAAALAGAVGIVDLVHIGLGVEGIGGANYAFQWLFAHQLGFAYADGTLVRWGRRGAALLAGTGLAALVLLTTVGGYPVSLVGVPGQDRSNAQPPSLAMVALTLWLLGLALLLRPAAQRWMARPGAWRRVRGLHAVLLTTFLWHVTAITMGGAAARGAGAPEPAIGSGRWWALRPAWLMWLLPFLLVLVCLFRRAEVHPAGRPIVDHPPAGAAAGFGVFAVAVGILGFGETGFFPFAPENGELILMFTFNPLQNLLHVLAGGAVLAGLGRSRRAAAGLTAAGALLFLLMGGLRLSGAGAARWLGMDEFTAWAHVVVGAAAATALMAAGWAAGGRFRFRAGRITMGTNSRGGQ